MTNRKLLYFINQDNLILFIDCKNYFKFHYQSVNISLISPGTPYTLTLANNVITSHCHGN